jgi:ribonucleoside-diphosphate reductase alpha chain
MQVSTHEKHANAGLNAGHLVQLAQLSGAMVSVKKKSGQTTMLSIEKVYSTLERACRGYEAVVSKEEVMRAALKNMFEGISTSDIETNLILATTAFIEKEPAYNSIAARLLAQKLYKEVMGSSVTEATKDQKYREAFLVNIPKGVQGGILDPRMLEFDLPALAAALCIERDDLFGYLGLQTLHERYFLKVHKKRIELPQIFWMRVAMGLCIEEQNKNEKAIAFYNQLSTMHYVSGTPTLFHSGTTHPQLSSCYLTTIPDDLPAIFKCLGDNAQLSKWSGGLGNDWSSIRATGSWIKTVGVTSQGVIPFLKIANDVTCAISRSGSRRGAAVAYLETWHYDIEDFLDLRRNTGDDRRRTHDMNTANWIPDLFMKRVVAGGDWTLFSPDEVPELHELYGKAFEEKYAWYEAEAAAGRIALFKTMPALQLWRKMLTRLFETGHPWLTFKDPSNVRSPQDHAGVVHSSNLCTEITLNTSAEETAVCNLGSVNLEKHVIDGKFDWEMLAATIKTAVHMLDNVIDINFYPTKEAQASNARHRPVGLGLMGLQDALYKMNLSMESPEALDVVDAIMEAISYHAIMASTQLAEEKGAYQTYKGSKWDRNLLPLDTIALLEQERGMSIDVDRKERMNWSLVRERIKEHGMRNSNLMAIAPTATISNISGCFPCAEPIYKNIYVKANMSGEFTVVNQYLVEDLKKLGLWDQDMLDLIKYYDGSIQKIEAIPADIRAKYKESFEIDPVWLLKLAAVRSKWIDQSQSHNVFMSDASGKKMHETYLAAWKMGLKSTYYYRTLGASQIEKSTLDAKKFGYTQKRVYQDQSAQAGQTVTEELPKACGITDSDCESCQ